MVSFMKVTLLLTPSLKNCAQRACIWDVTDNLVELGFVDASQIRQRV
jgi:hypothetical protein